MKSDELEESEWLNNPIRAAVLGLVLAALVQSGSAMISIMVGMVAARSKF